MLFGKLKREKELSTSDMEYIKIEGEKCLLPLLKGTMEDKGKAYDTHFFDTKLPSLKEFIEQNIATYVNKVITPKNKELDFYITQSWINVLKPGEGFKEHYHANSLISGVFYVSVTKGDALTFYDQNIRTIDIEAEKSNSWNYKQIYFEVENNALILFPSRMMHATKTNPERTADRISIAFNVFVKGKLGKNDLLDELTI